MDHEVLLRVIEQRVKDQDVLWLIRIILDQYHSECLGKGMPLGNWTSQFFANVYLNQLDQFVKHELKAKYYLRYVDDFVILDKSKKKLRYYEKRISEFLKSLKLQLHPDKCRIIPLGRGVDFLGFRVFYHCKLVRKRNWRKIKARVAQRIQEVQENKISAWRVIETLQSWNAYAMHGSTFGLRENLRKQVEQCLLRANELRQIASQIQN